MSLILSFVKYLLLYIGTIIGASIVHFFVMLLAQFITTINAGFMDFVNVIGINTLDFLFFYPIFTGTIFFIILLFYFKIRKRN